MEFLNDMPLLPRVVLLTVVSYAYLIVVIRLTGKRSVAHMNSFDWLVNVAVGALTASAILTPGNTAEAFVAIATVVALQTALTRAALHFGWVRRLVREEPRLLMRSGQMLRDAMRDAAVSDDELMQAIRAAGLRGPGEVAAIVFEADGSLSVIANSGEQGDGGDMRALQDLGGPYEPLLRPEAAE